MRRFARPKATQLASSVQLGEGLKHLESEPSIWEPKNKRNKAGSQFRTSNTSHIKDNAQTKPGSQIWSITSQTKSAMEYNYGGYVSQPQSNTAKHVEESFFNSIKPAGGLEHTRNAAFSKSQTS